MVSLRVPKKKMLYLVACSRGVGGWEFAIAKLGQDFELLRSWYLLHRRLLLFVRASDRDIVRASHLANEATKTRESVSRNPRSLDEAKSENRYIYARKKLKLNMTTREEDEERKKEKTPRKVQREKLPPKSGANWLDGTPPWSLSYSPVSKSPLSICIKCHTPRRQHRSKRKESSNIHL